MSSLTIKTITAEYYQTIINGAIILEQDTTAPKVMRLSDGSFLKLFRRKRQFSSELFYPYVSRFANNAIMLKKLGIAVPEILSLYRFAYNELNFTAVHYKPLPGDTLRSVLAISDDITKQYYIKLFGVLLATLHQHGVYFRSIHLANVLVLPNKQLGLIDFADMSKQSFALSQSKRARNLKHLKRYEKDVHWLFYENYAIFLAAYESIAGVKQSRFLQNTKE